MVRINLIKQRYVLPVERRARALFSIGVFLPFLLFCFLILGVVHSVNNTVIHSYTSLIEKQKDSLKEAQKKALTPTKEEVAWQTELRNSAAFQEQYLLLAPKLVVLADTIPGRLYLNRISFDGKTLLLEGMGLPGNQTTTALADFLEKLNGNDNFGQGLAEIKLEEVKTEAGVSNFKIVGIKK